MLQTDTHNNFHSGEHRDLAARFQRHNKAASRHQTEQKQSSFSRKLLSSIGF